VAVGEAQNRLFQLSFNSSLKVDFQGSAVTSDGGLILVRELDERLGFGELIERHLTDARGKNTQLPLADLLRQSVYSRKTLPGSPHSIGSWSPRRRPSIHLDG
jgi:Transposase DDE domain group 1